MQLHRLLVPIALLPAALSAQTTVFEADFSSGELNPATYDVGADWTIASTKAITTSSLSASGLAYGIGSTSSGFAEIQGRVLSSPVTLSSTGDFVTLTVTFTNTSNLMAGSDSSVTFGLYDTGATNPLTGLANNLAGTDMTTGGAAGWSGYVLRFVNTGSHAIYTRPVQSDTVNESQELLYNNRGGGAYDAPGGTDIATVAGTNVALGASAYTATFTITQNSDGGQDITGSLFSGVGTGGSVLASISGTSATPVTSSFSGLAIGFRDGDSVTALATTMEIDAITLTAAAVPEPSSFAALAGAAGLGLAALRRRRH